MEQHDAYVARIQLLTTYEDVDQHLPSSSMSTEHPSVSTSTLVPTHSSRMIATELNTEERTPRSSFEDAGIMGIGNLMLTNGGDRSFESQDSSSRFSANAPPVRPLRSPTRVSAILAPPSGPANPPDGRMVNSQGREPGLGGGLDPEESSRASLTLPWPAGNDAGTASLPVMRRLIIPPPRRESIEPGLPPSGPTALPPVNVSPSQRDNRDGSVSVSGSPHGSSRPVAGLVTEPDSSQETMEVLNVSPSSPSLSPENDKIPNGSVTNTSRRPSGSFSLGPASGIRPLPPIPHSAPLVDSLGHPVVGKRRENLNPMAFDRDLPSPSTYLVNLTTAQGTINQRRQIRTDGTMEGSTDAPRLGPATQGPSPSFNPFPGASIHISVSVNSPPAQLPAAVDVRSRTKSQPNSRQTPWGVSQSDADVPPLPQPIVRKRTSFIESNHGSGFTSENGSLAPPIGLHSRSPTSTSRSLPLLPDSGASGSLISPLPEPQPREIIHRPFHLLRVLYASMDPDSSGSYLTGAIHISSAVWKSSNWAKSAASSKALGPPKITAQDVKVRCIEALLLHLEIIRQTGSGLLDGPRDGRYGSRSGMMGGAASQRATGIAEEFCGALDGLDEEMDQGYKALVKAGVGVGGWKGKKTGVGRFVQLA